MEVTNNASPVARDPVRRRATCLRPLSLLPNGSLLIAYTCNGTTLSFLVEARRHERRRAWAGGLQVRASNLVDRIAVRGCQHPDFVALKGNIYRRMWQLELSTSRA
uniref:Uncharacterized protein n=1 Tax=Oryza glaberrima TaxID=4538 RepID=I1P6K1_ORYGL